MNKIPKKIGAAGGIFIVFGFFTAMMVRPQSVAPYVHENYNFVFDLNPDGTATLTTELIDRLNTAQAVTTYSSRSIYYNSLGEEVELLEAAVIKPDGTQVPVPVQSIQSVPATPVNGQPAPAGLVQKTVNFPGLIPGGGIRVKFKRIYSRPQYNKHFSRLLMFPANEIWQNVKFTVNYPPELDLNFEAGAFQELPAKEIFGRSQRVFQGKFEKPVTVGNYAVDFFDFSPRFVISTFQDYAEFGRAYRAKIPKTIPAEVKTLADSLTRDVTEPLPQARLLYDWVRQNIAYSPLPYGTGNPVPFQTDNTLTDRFGDSQRHTVLLRQLLATKNIKSELVLISFSNTHILPQAPCLEFFNHVVLYLPDLNTFLDTTLKFAPYGVLNGWEYGKQGLLISEQPRLIDLPKGVSGENQTQTEVKMQLEPDGKVTGQSVTTAKGRLDYVFRFFYSYQLPANQDSFVRNQMSQIGEIGSGRFETNDLLKTNEDFKISAQFKIETGINPSNPGALVMPTGFNPYSLNLLILQYNGLEPTTAISVGANTYHENYSLTFPATSKILTLPKDVNFQNAAGSYRSIHQQEGQKIIIKRELITNRDIYQAAEFSTLKELFETVIRDLKGQILYQ